MKNLFSLLLFVALSSMVKAQVPGESYFEKIFVVVEQQVDFAGGRDNFNKVINNNIVFPKIFSKKDKNGNAYLIHLKVSCLVSPEGKVLHVQSQYTNGYTIAEKDLYYIQNQIACLFVNMPKTQFKPARLNGRVTYGIYEEEITISKPKEQKPLPDFAIKPDKGFYKKPAAVHFMEMPPTYGANTAADFAKNLYDNVGEPAVLPGHTFTFTAYLYIDENGAVKGFSIEGPQLMKDGKSVYYEPNTPESLAYNNWAWAIDKYVKTQTGWKAGTIGGYAKYAFIKIPVCLGNCP